MKSSRFLRNIVSHAVAVMLGVVFTFSNFHVLSSQAKLIVSVDNNNNNNSVLLAQANSNTTIGSQSFVAQAINKTGPAVVRIDTEATVTSRTVNPFTDDPFFQEFFGDSFGDDSNRTNKRQVRGQGSGFITDRSGIILTNAHVVSEADKVTVTLKDGREFQGKVMGTDEVTDLAVVKIQPSGEDLPVAVLGDSSQVRVGDWAIAVGNPIGLNNTVTLGIISTLQRSAAQAGITDKRIDFLQTDAAINPGNSGGPLLNDRGEVIGINTAIRADATGIGFAIPINKAKSIQTTLASGKKVSHPYIGIQMQNLTPELAKEVNNDPNANFSLPETKGVLVMGVLPNTPAENAGIRRGDAIVAVNGDKITDASQLQGIVENSGIGKQLKLEIIRNDRRLEVSITTAQMENRRNR
jgi:Do/DeqQ family serine protease